MLSLNHHMIYVINVKKFITVCHKVNPTITSIIIDKQNIKSISALTEIDDGPSYIKVN